MGTEHGSGSGAAVLPSLDLRKVSIHIESGSTAQLAAGVTQQLPQLFAQVRDRKETQDQQGTAIKSKTDIFSPRSPVYRTPLTSRRNNGNNLPAGQQKVPGLILPQAPYHLGNLQQQHLQHNGVSLYSPRGKASVHTAVQGQAPASALSARQARRMVSKDHSNPSKGLMGTSPPSNLAKSLAHAAPAAGRPAVPPLTHQTSQQQSQLYSPRRYAVPAPLEGLSPRAALHCHHTGGAGSHAQPAGGSSTWRGPLNSPRVQHAPAPNQQLSKHQSLQSSPSILPASRSALCTNLHHSDSTHLFVRWCGFGPKNTYGKLAFHTAAAVHTMLLLLELAADLLLWVAQLQNSSIQIL